MKEIDLISIYDVRFPYPHKWHAVICYLESKGMKASLLQKSHDAFIRIDLNKQDCCLLESIMCDFLNGYHAVFIRIKPDLRLPLTFTDLTDISNPQHHIFEQKRNYAGVGIQGNIYKDGELYGMAEFNGSYFKKNFYLTNWLYHNCNSKRFGIGRHDTEYCVCVRRNK